MSRPASPTLARAYLLLEVMAAGALLAIATGAALALIASSSADVSYANHKAVAGGLARAKADELAAQATCTGSQAAFGPVGPAHPQFQWRFNVVDAPASAASNPPLPAGSVCEVQVDVRFPAATRSRDDQLDGVVDGKAIASFRRLYAP